MRKLVLALTAASMAMPVVAVAPADARSGYYNGRVWHDSRGRLRCRRPNGTVGLIVGGAGGALIGREIDGGRHRTTGTVIGAAAGALIGRHIQRHSGRRCR
jgi:outer membrane lipoprotein SlyB